MLKREKLIITLLVSTMYTSLLPTTISFAEATGTASNQLASSTVTSEADFTFDASTGTVIKYIGTNSIVVIPSTINDVPVKIIGDDAFVDNTNITSVEIPDGVISIGRYSFYRCYKLTKLIIPDSVTIISGSKSVFTSTDTLFYVESERVKQILMDECGVDERKIRVNGQLPIAFRFDANTGTITKYNGADTAVVIPSMIDGVLVKGIADQAFLHNNDIISVEISGSVTSIGNETFSSCKNLTRIIIPNSVVNIGDYAFSGCSSLANIIIPDGITRIGDGAFEGCTSLKNITIPSSVTSIGVDAFGNCGNLTNIIIPNNVKRIEDSAFYGCSSFTNITIPNGVTSIGKWAFGDCNELTSIIIPDSVTSIGDNAFYECNNALFYVKSETTKQLLINYGISEIKIILVNSQTSIDFIFDSNTRTIKKYIGADTEVVIPSTINDVSVECIGDEAFKDNINITSVEIPSGVTSIGNLAFDGCRNLKNITIPNSVTSIKPFAFSGCVDLTSITLPNNLTSIGGYAFSDCTHLTSINIPNNVTSIEQDAFYECDDTVFYVERENIKQLLIDSGVDESKIILNGQLPTIKVSSIVINATNINLTVGQTETFTATVLPSNAANKGLIWKSSNNLVATVDANGKVTAVGAGSATITCTANDGSRVVSNIGITVSTQTTSNSDSVLKSVSISGTEKVGHKLKAKIKYDGTEPSLKYKWQRASRINENFQDIDGANDNEYKLKSSDKNKFIKLAVTEVINGRIFTLEDMTGRIKANSSDNNEEEENTSSNSSNSNSLSATALDNSSNNIVLRPETDEPSSLNSQSPANGRFRNPSGGIMTGWIKDNGIWYYLYSNGQMAGGTTVDGYLLDYNGKLIE